MSEAALAAMFFYDALGDSSGVLISKLGLRDQRTLEQAETAITSLRSLALPAHSDVHSYEGFKAIHKHLFGEIYEWAGCERPYMTGRGPVAFAKHEFIKSWCVRHPTKNKTPVDPCKNIKAILRDKHRSTTSKLSRN